MGIFALVLAGNNPDRPRDAAIFGALAFAGLLLVVAVIGATLILAGVWTA
jgi:hypothetical protein